MKTQKKKRDIVCDIPGGLYGNNPGCIQSDYAYGNVAVDIYYVYQALRWLKKRKAEILGTSNPETDVVLIAYRIE